MMWEMLFAKPLLPRPPSPSLRAEEYTVERVGGQQRKMAAALVFSDVLHVRDDLSNLHYKADMSEIFLNSPTYAHLSIKRSETD